MTDPGRDLTDEEKAEITRDLLDVFLESDRGTEKD